jgi:hypothetical protein
MIKPTNDNYILSPIIDHKENYEIGDVKLKIVKDYENNLRSRNCQLGIVEALSSENKLNLKVGDTVFVHHFTFHWDIGGERSFTFQKYFEMDGKMLFPVHFKKIFFKYNDGDIEPLGTNMIVEEVTPEQDKDAIIKIEQKPFKDRARVIYSQDTSLIGFVVMVDTNALYPLEIKGKNYFKINDYEISAVISGDEAYPAKNWVLLEDENDEFTSSIPDLDLSFVKRPNTTKAKIIRTGILTNEFVDWIKADDIVVRHRNAGVKFNNQWLVNLHSDNIHVVMI